MHETAEVTTFIGDVNTDILATKGSALDKAKETLTYLDSQASKLREEQRILRECIGPGRGEDEEGQDKG